MLTPLQSAVSRRIYETVRVFPAVISDLISTYDTDEELLQRALTRTNLKITVERCGTELTPGTFYRHLRDPAHRAYCEAVKYCLSSPYCDPAVRTQVIKTALGAYHEIRYLHDRDVRYGHARWVFSLLLSQLRNESKKINFDQVDLSGVYLQDFNLDMISAVGAKFVQTQLQDASLRYADLTAADFSNTKINRARLDGANMSHAILRRTCFSGAVLRSVNLTGAKIIETLICESDDFVTDLTGLITSDRALNNFLLRFREKPSDEVLVSGKVSLNTEPKKVLEKSGCIVS